MNKLLIGAATVASIAAFPIASFAATYQYVNTSGMLETETAANSSLALTQPMDIAPDSGVILVPDTSVSPITTTVTTTGTVTPVPATTVTAPSNFQSQTNVIWPGQQFNTNSSTTASAALVGTYTGAAPTNFSNGTMFYLNLAPGNSGSSNGGNAMLTTTSTGANPTVLNGTWQVTGSNQVLVTLTSNGSASIGTPQTILFSVNGQTLSASQYNSTVYGTSGFTLTK